MESLMQFKGREDRMKRKGLKEIGVSEKNKYGEKRKRKRGGEKDV
jgi:hypothetical protein